ncbi:MAG: DUF6531 domain-containing protein, partial [Planctomycetota bacterium]
MSSASRLICMVAVLLLVAAVVTPPLHSQEATDSAGNTHGLSVWSGSSDSADRDQEFRSRSATARNRMRVGGLGVAADGVVPTSSSYSFHHHPVEPSVPSISLVTPSSDLTDSMLSIAIVGRGTHWRQPAAGTWSTVSAPPLLGPTTLVANGNPGWANDQLNGLHIWANVTDTPGNRTLWEIVDTVAPDTIIINGDITSDVQAGDAYILGTNVWITDGSNDLVIDDVMVPGNNGNVILLTAHLTSLDGSPDPADTGDWDVVVTTPDLYSGDGAYDGEEQITLENGFAVRGNVAGAPTLSITSPADNDNVTASTFSVDLSYSSDKDTSTLWITADVTVDDHPAGANLADYFGFSFGSTTATSTATKADFDVSDGPVTLQACIRDVEGFASDLAEVTFFIDADNSDLITSVSPSVVARGSTGTSITVSFSGTPITGTGLDVTAPASTGLTLYNENDPSSSQVTFDLDTSSTTEIGRHVFTITDNSVDYDFVFWVKYPVDGSGFATYGPGVRGIRDDSANQPQEPSRSMVTGAVGVYMNSGEYAHSATDMVIPAGKGMPFTFTRTYRSTIDYHGPLGHNWDFNWNQRVEFHDNNPSANSIRFWNGAGRVDDFTYEDNTGSDYDAYFKDGFYLRFDVYSDYEAGTLRSGAAQSGDVITCKDPHGNVMIFTPAELAPFGDDGGSSWYGGRLDRIVDRNGNTQRCVYNSLSQLIRVIDTHGRGIEFAWADDGYLAEIRDYTEDPDWYRSSATRRAITFDVDASGDLVEVFAPETDAYNGGSRLSVQYGYDEDGDDQLEGAMSGDHYLTSITDGKGQKYLENYYDELTGNSLAMVIKQKFGSAGQFFYINYDSSGTSGFATGVSGVTMTDSFASWGTNQYAGLIATINSIDYRVVSNTSTVLTLDATVSGGGGVAYSLPTQTSVIDRMGYKTIYQLNGDGTLAELARCTGTWNSTGTSQTGGKVRDGSGDEAEDPEYWLTTFDSYNANFELETMTLPLGNTVDWTFDDANVNPQAQGNLLTVVRTKDGTRSADQATIKVRYTYESTYNFVQTAISARAYDTGDAIWNGSPPSEATREATFTTTFVRDYEDAGEGHGNLVRVVLPEATLTDGNPQSIVTHTAYNESGQVVASIDGEGTVTRYDYYASGPQAHYLQATTHDVGGRNTRTEYTWDAVGNLITVTDPRGNVTTYTPNEFGQNVLTTFPTLSSRGGGTYYQLQFFDENGNLEYSKWSNVDKSGSGPSAPSTFTTPGSYTAPSWITTQFTYNVLDAVVTTVQDVTSITTRTWRNTYDANYRVIKRETPLAVATTEPYNFTSTVFDERSMVFQAWRAQGDTSGISTSYAGSTATLDNQAKTEFDYDLNGNCVTVRAYRELDYLVSTITWPRETGSPGITSIDEMIESTMDYDGQDRLVTSTDDAGHYSQRKYNALGQVTQSWAANSSNDLLAGSIVDYDELSRASGSHVLAITSSHGAIDMSLAGSMESVRTSYINGSYVFDTDRGAGEDDGFADTYVLFNKRSQVVQSTDDRGNSTDNTFDTAGWLVTTQAPQVTDETARNAVWYLYDRAGNVVETISELVDSETSAITRLHALTAYDEHNQAYRYTDPKGASWSWKRSSLGVVTESTDPLNHLMRRTHDLLGRVTQTTYVAAGNGGSDIDNYCAYDINDRPSSRTDDEGYDETYTYNVRNELTEVAGEDGTSETFYHDDLGNIFKSVDRSGNIAEKEYDDRNLLRTVRIIPVTPSGSMPFEFIRTTWESYTYDGLGRLASSTNWETKSGNYEGIQQLIPSYNSFSLPDSTSEEIALTSVPDMQTAGLAGPKTTTKTYNGLGYGL